MRKLCAVACEYYPAGHAGKLLRKLLKTYRTVGALTCDDSAFAAEYRVVDLPAAGVHAADDSAVSSGEIVRYRLQRGDTHALFPCAVAHSLNGGNPDTKSRERPRTHCYSGGIEVGNFYARAFQHAFHHREQRLGMRVLCIQKLFGDYPAVAVHQRAARRYRGAVYA